MIHIAQNFDIHAPSNNFMMQLKQKQIPHVSLYVLCYKYINYF